MKQSTIQKTKQQKRKTLVGKTSKIGRRVRATVGKSVKPSACLASLTAVALNLKSSPDRWVRLQKSVAKNAPWLKLKRLEAVDGRVQSIPVKDVCKKYSTERLAKLFHWYRSKTLTFSAGERGCSASHLKAWRKCAASNKPLIVLEDDASILPSFTDTLDKALKEAPSDIGCIWLTSKDRAKRKRVGEVLMQPSYLWTTVGYVIWPSAARTFLKLLPMDTQVDNFMGWHVLNGNVKGFSVRPACVRQANTWNIRSTVLHSDDVTLWNHPSNAGTTALCYDSTLLSKYLGASKECGFSE